MKLTRTAFLSVLLTIGVSGCAERHVTPGFGNSLRQDLAAQITDPNPDYRKTPRPPTNGSRADLAMQRYRADRVQQPTVNASQIGTIGPSSGGGGGGGGDAGAGVQTGAGGP